MNNSISVKAEPDQGGDDLLATAQGQGQGQQRPSTTPEAKQDRRAMSTGQMEAPPITTMPWTPLSEDDIKALQQRARATVSPAMLARHPPQPMPTHPATATLSLDSAQTASGSSTSSNDDDISSRDPQLSDSHTLLSVQRPPEQITPATTAFAAARAVMIPAHPTSSETLMNPPAGGAILPGLQQEGLAQRLVQTQHVPQPTQVPLSASNTHARDPSSLSDEDVFQKNEQLFDIYLTKLQTQLQEFPDVLGRLSQFFMDTRAWYDGAPQWSLYLLEVALTTLIYMHHHMQNPQQVQTAYQPACIAVYHYVTTLREHAATRYSRISSSLEQWFSYLTDAWNAMADAQPNPAERARTALKVGRLNLFGTLDMRAPYRFKSVPGSAPPASQVLQHMQQHIIVPPMDPLTPASNSTPTHQGRPHPYARPQVVTNLPGAPYGMSPTSASTYNTPVQQTAPRSARPQQHRSRTSSVSTVPYQSSQLQQQLPFTPPSYTTQTLQHQLGHSLIRPLGQQQSPDMPPPNTSGYVRPVPVSTQVTLNASPYPPFVPPSLPSPTRQASNSLSGTRYSMSTSRANSVPGPAKFVTHVSDEAVGHRKHQQKRKAKDIEMIDLTTPSPVEEKPNLGIRESVSQQLAAPIAATSTLAADSPGAILGTTIVEAASVANDKSNHNAASIVIPLSLANSAVPDNTLGLKLPSASLTESSKASPVTSSLEPFLRAYITRDHPTLTSEAVERRIEQLTAQGSVAKLGDAVASLKSKVMLDTQPNTISNIVSPTGGSSSSQERQLGASPGAGSAQSQAEVEMDLQEYSPMTPIPPEELGMEEDELDDSFSIGPPAAPPASTAATKDAQALIQGGGDGGRAEVIASVSPGTSATMHSPLPVHPDDTQYTLSGTDVALYPTFKIPDNPSSASELSFGFQLGPAKPSGFSKHVFRFEFSASVEECKAARRWMQRYEAFDPAAFHVIFRVNVYDAEAALGRMSVGRPAFSLPSSFPDNGLVGHVNPTPSNLKGTYSFTLFNHPPDKPLDISAGIRPGHNVVEFTSWTIWEDKIVAVERVVPFQDDWNKTVEWYHRTGKKLSDSLGGTVEPVPWWDKWKGKTPSQRVSG